MNVPLPNTAVPMMDSTVWPSFWGIGSRWWASTLRPKKQPPRMVPIQISVIDGVASARAS